MTLKTPGSPNVNLGQPQVLRKLDELKTKLLPSDRTDHFQEVLGWEKEAKKELLKLDLAGHDGVKLFLKGLSALMLDIDDVLKSSKSSDLPDSERDGLIETKKVIEWIFGFFGDAKTYIDRLEEEVDKNLDADEEEAVEETP